MSLNIIIIIINNIMLKSILTPTNKIFSFNLPFTFPIRFRSHHISYILCYFCQGNNMGWEGELIFKHSNSNSASDDNTTRPTKLEFLVSCSSSCVVIILFTLHFFVFIIKNQIGMLIPLPPPNLTAIFFIIQIIPHPHPHPPNANGPIHFPT